MKRGIVLAIVVVLISAMLCGFASHKPYEYRSNDFYYFVDKETGVNYVVYSEVYKAGICPRYNSDGSLYVSKGK